MEAVIESLMRGLGQGSVYAMLGLGFVIVYKGTEVVNFAQPALMILGAFFVSWFTFDVGVPFFAAVPLAMLAAALLGASIERIALRPMVGQPVFSAAMVTVGVFFALLTVATRLIGTDIRRAGDPWGLETIMLGDIRLFQVDIAKLVVGVLAFAIVGAYFKYSRSGLAIRATASDQETALAQGVKVGRMFGLSWALAGALGALAGVFIGAGGVGFEPITALVALKALPAIILGGLDSIKGALIGGLAIGIIESMSRTYQPGFAPWLGANFDQVVPYLVMLIVLMIRPYGLFGTPEIERV
ncbi:MAG: branched-chain amino acid ABC transporter permease [Intrasporangiaceae bacterium]|nr:branched-chain amino acid ABC transporter permease [Intrasporangiaceae bacterium]